MNRCDINELKEFLKDKIFEKARMNRYTGEKKEFDSPEKLLEWLLHHTPGEGSFILLQGGGWIEWQCVAVAYDYCHRWELHQRPMW